MPLYPSNDRIISTVSIANGESVSAAVDLEERSLLALIMPAAWTAAALTVEVSHDGTTWIGIVYDSLGVQANVIASPAVSTAYTLDALGLLPYRYMRLRSGTTASAVNQLGARSITAITPPLA